MKKSKLMIQLFAIIVLLGISLYTVAEPTSSVEYKISKQFSFGTDINVVEFTPKSRPDYTCIITKLGNSGGISCFPKATQIYK